jgi:hypothetical protein
MPWALAGPAPVLSRTTTNKPVQSALNADLLKKIQPSKSWATTSVTPRFPSVQSQTSPFATLERFDATDHGFFTSSRWNLHIVRAGSVIEVV